MPAPLPATPFPLPLISLPRRSASRSRRCIIRASQARLATRLANSSSQSLNVLAGYMDPPLVRPPASISGHQKATIEHLLS